MIYLHRVKPSREWSKVIHAGAYKIRLRPAKRSSGVVRLAWRWDDHSIFFFYKNCFFVCQMSQFRPKSKQIKCRQDAGRWLRVIRLKATPIVNHCHHRVVHKMTGRMMRRDEAGRPGRGTGILLIILLQRGWGNFVFRIESNTIKKTFMIQVDREINWDAKDNSDSDEMRDV